MKWLPIAALVSFNLFSNATCAQVAMHQENLRRVDEENAVANRTVLLNNESRMIPVQQLEKRSFAAVNIGFPESETFDSLLAKYVPVRRFSSSNYQSDSLNLTDLNTDLKLFSTVIVSVTDRSVINPETLAFLNEVKKGKQLIVAVFGSSKVLGALDDLNVPIISSEKHNAEAASFVAQAIFGGEALTAKLNSNISPKFRSGMGFTTEQIRLQYAMPESVGINADHLQPIDGIVAEAIREKAAPGAVVMVVKDGKVIFNKSYGSHTYDNTTPTRIDDIFDLASVTKTSATTMAVMRLFEQNRLNLDSNVTAYIPNAVKTNKNDIKVREVMLHQAGFTPYIPFYQKLKATDYSRDSSALYPVKVADNYYLRRNYYEDVMWPQMLRSPILTRGKYVYSDLSMYFMKEMVERQASQRLDQYVLNQFYQPLGMQTAGFNPRNRFAKERIVPTENDVYFRKTLLEGYVHDQGAAMVGGVSGHAGLFASSNDLAILYQMLLNGGTYGGQQYFKSETVNMFTAKQSDVSRRGLGFDRWDPESSKGYPSKLASPKTFGHTGYTGTCVWVDPECNLVYIFLSNRVNPTVSEKLGQLNIRARIQDTIYEAIKKADK